MSIETSPSGSLKLRRHDPILRQQILDADIILGVAADDESNQSIFFGAGLFRHIVLTGSREYAYVLRVPIDFNTDDLECLAAMCEVLKGSCCYKSLGGIPDDQHRP